MNEQGQLIAKRVAEVINDTSGKTLDVVAEYSRRSIFKLSEDSGIEVGVLHRGTLETVATRSEAQQDYRIGVSIQRKIAVDENEDEADLLDQLADDIATVLRFTRLNASDSSWSAIWTATELDVEAAAVAAEEFNQYANVQTFTFRMLG